MKFDLQMIGNLLDAAKAMTGSDYQTSKKIRASRANLSDWRAGRRPIPAADIVLLASLAGLDPVEWGSRAIQAAHEGTEKGDALAEALKKALEVTGEGEGSTEREAGYFIRCINCLVFVLRQRPIPYRFATCYA